MPTFDRPAKATSGAPTGGRPSERAAAKMNSHATREQLAPGLRPVGGGLRLAHTLGVFAGAPGEQLEQIVPKLDLHARLGHDVVLLEDRQRIVPGPVDDEARRERAEHEGEDDRHPGEHRLLNRIGRLGVHLHLEEHRHAHDERPDAEREEMAEHRQGGRLPRDQAEQREHVGRIGRAKIPDPAEERRVPHLDGDENDLVEREEHRDLDHHRQTAGDRIDPLALEQLHLLLLLLGAIVRIELLQRGDLRLDLLHLRHRLVGAIGEREEGELDEDGDDEDRDAEIADDLVDGVDAAGTSGS